MKSIKNISRFEIKYKLSYSQSNKLYNRISNILIPDSNSKNDNGYGNYSIYFEAPGWRYKNEKVEGLALRTKPRLRVYKRLSDFKSLAYFFELKHRINSRITKERVLVNQEEIKLLLDPVHQGCDLLKKSSPVLDKFYYLARRYDLRPALSVFYHRRAYTVKFSPGLRITFDSFVSASKQTIMSNIPHNLTPIIPHNESIIEIKYNDRIPSWILQIIKNIEMERISVSKYATAASVLYGNIG